MTKAKTAEKRPRGRPRKTPVKPAGPKRPTGRPPKAANYKPPVEDPFGDIDLSVRPREDDETKDYTANVDPTSWNKRSMKGLSGIQRDVCLRPFTLSVLSEIFNKSRPHAQKLLHECPRIGVEANGGFPVYSLRDAARFLVDPVVDIEEYIKRLHPTKWPLAMQSEYWKAQNQRLKYKKDNGELWRTEAVEAVVSDLMAIFRQQVRMIDERVDEQASLTKAQRSLVSELLDQLLMTTKEKVIEHFSQHDGSNDRAEDHADRSMDDVNIEKDED